MRALALGLLAGVLWLQSRATLPDQWLLLGLFFLSLLLVAVAMGSVRKLADRPSDRRWLILSLLLLLAGGVMGSSWSGLRAQHRLRHSVSPALEGRDLSVRGEVRGLPDVSAAATRFRFHPLSASLPDGIPLQLPRDLPGDLSVGWYADKGASPPVLRAGEQWQLTVRVKRPHGLINPAGFDAEAWMLNENLRATAYVRPGGGSRLSVAPPWRQSPGAATDNLRAVIREKIRSALNGQPYAGVFVALVVGDQRAIGQKDWDVFAKTGIGHLVSISGLHITMIAAMVATMFHWGWRQSFFTRWNLPLRLPAQRAAVASGVVAACFYVALAGFGIPAQRTLLMLGVAGVALWTHRTPAVSKVLSLALTVVVIVDPWSVLWPGFWLSFVAIACILYASAGRQEITVRVTPDVSPGVVASTVASLRSAARTQWVVTLGLLPLSVAWFAQVSLVSPLANAVAIPLVSFAVTPLSLIGSVLPEPLSSPLLSLAHTLMAWLADWLGWLASADWATWLAPQPDWSVFAVAMAGTLWALAPQGWPLRRAGLLCWLPLLMAQASAPSEGFWLTAFDIGQGNAVLVETASHRLMYDTGPAFSAETDGGLSLIHI